MHVLTHSADTVAAWNDARHGPLPALLLILTMVAGLVDAVSYLKLGHMFVANMTGNVVFLGFAVADAKDYANPASLVAIAVFFAGALAGGHLGSNVAHHRARLLAIATYIQIALVGVTLIVSTLALDTDANLGRYAVIVLLAAAMGLQTATARHLGVPGLTTTVLTTMLAGLAADSTLAGGKNPDLGRRLLATAAMLLSAACGAFLTFHVGINTVLALTVALLASIAMSAHRMSSSPTRGPLSPYRTRFESLT